VTSGAAPLSRSHSTERIPRLEFEGSSIALRYDAIAGISTSAHATMSTRRTRDGALGRARRGVSTASRVS